MTRTSRFILVAAVAALATAGGYLAGQAFTPGGKQIEGVSATAADSLLRLTLSDTDGVDQTMGQWQDKVMVVNFWATWCPPCIKEIPEFSAVSRRHADNGVQFVGISIDSLENVQDFQERFDVPYPLLIGSPQTLALAAEFGNTARALPFTVIMGPGGIVSDVTLGTLSEEELDEKILRQLNP